MRHVYLTSVLVLLTLGVNARIHLGAAAPFGVIAGASISNGGSTIVSGDIGLYPNKGYSLSGFPPGKAGAIYAGDATAKAAHHDAQVAYDMARVLVCDVDLTGRDLRGMTLKKGVYCYESSATLMGTLVLDGADDPSSSWVFQIGASISIGPFASVILVGGALPSNVFWQVGASASFAPRASFVGSTLAAASIALAPAVRVDGGVYSLGASVSMVYNTITAPANLPKVIPLGRILHN